jgi:hypothetical protein
VAGSLLCEQALGETRKLLEDRRGVRRRACLPDDIVAFGRQSKLKEPAAVVLGGDELLEARLERWLSWEAPTKTALEVLRGDELRERSAVAVDPTLYDGLVFERRGADHAIVAGCFGRLEQPRSNSSACAAAPVCAG